jgi:beta-galactosidase
LKDHAAKLFNSGWKFLLGNPKNAHKEHFSDETWKHVSLPHDWVISRPYRRGAQDNSWTHQNMQGFFAWEGIAWYRREFILENIAGKETYIYFGGAYRNSTVYVNGHEAGGRASGYSSFELNITGFVKEGRNSIAVRLDNGCEAPDRWYSGSGLFRNVYLKVVPPIHIKTWGVQVKSKVTHNKSRELSAEIEVETTIINHNSAAKNSQGRVCLRVSGPAEDGHVADNIAEDFTPYRFSAKDEMVVRQKIVIKKPLLWSAETPHLYTASVHLEPSERKENSPIQPVEVRFGIRDIEIAYGSGMTVNKIPVKLKGVCLHHDCGITGSAFYDSVWRRRLLALKSIGCNAIRTSHNPQAEEFLDLCDEMGFYVIDECFDKWKSGYYAAHFDADAKRDLSEFILRDRNHPSVFLWSIGNEVENQGTPEMLKIQKALVSAARSLDSRPVTCALEPHVHPKTLIGAPAAELVKITKKLAKDVDVLGLNYHEDLFRDYSAAIDKPIISTECYEYYSGTALNFEDVTTKNPWQFVVENDNVIGQFIWAGIDYLGESSWPAKGWTGAVLDICGFRKPNAWFRASIWSDEPVVYLAFHDQNIKPDYCRGRWSFPPLSSHLNHNHFKRRTVTAVIFTNCETVSLWINEKKLGSRKPKDFVNGIIEWTFEYTSGEIKTVGYRGGKAVSEYCLKTAGEAKKILLVPDKTNIACLDTAHIEVNITDENGILCPNAEIQLNFTLAGDGEILGACSPDLSSGMGFTLPRAVTSGGKALVIIKAGASPGPLELNAYGEALEPAALRFNVLEAR